MTHPRLPTELAHHVQNRTIALQGRFHRISTVKAQTKPRDFQLIRLWAKQVQVCIHGSSRPNHFQPCSCRADSRCQGVCHTGATLKGLLNRILWKARRIALNHKGEHPYHMCSVRARDILEAPVLISLFGLRILSYLHITQLAIYPDSIPSPLHTWSGSSKTLLETLSAPPLLGPVSMRRQ